MRLWENIKAKVQGKFWKRNKKGVSILEEAEAMQPKEEPKTAEPVEPVKPEVKQGDG